MNQLSRAEVQHIKLKHIAVGPRLRGKIGSVVELKKSIDDLGLIHPIVVTEAKELTAKHKLPYMLVAGERRLRAYSLLRESTIPARVTRVLANELMLIEQDENEQRSDLDAYSASRARWDEVEKEYQRLISEHLLAVTGSASRARPVAKSTQKKLRTAAYEATGVSRKLASKDATIVRAVKKYPELERWSQRTIKKAEEALDDLPRTERRDARIFLATFEPRECIQAAEAIANLGDWPEPLRRKVFQVAKKDPGHAQSAALGLPPVPDGRFISVGIIMKDLEKVIQQHRQRDEASLELKSALGYLKTAHQILKRAYELKRSEFETMITDT